MFSLTVVLITQTFMISDVYEKTREPFTIQIRCRLIEIVLSQVRNELMDWTDYLPTVPTVLSVLAFLISSLALYLSMKQFARNQQMSIVPILAFTRRD